MPCEDHVVGRADCPECVIIDTAERGPADTNVESATLVTDADLYIPRPDLGEHAHTFIAAGDEVPAHLAHLVPAKPAPARKR